MCIHAVSCNFKLWLCWLYALYWALVFFVSRREYIKSSMQINPCALKHQQGPFPCCKMKLPRKRGFVLFSRIGRLCKSFWSLAGDCPTITSSTESGITSSLSKGIRRIYSFTRQKRFSASNSVLELFQMWPTLDVCSTLKFLFFPSLNVFLSCKYWGFLPHEDCNTAPLKDVYIGTLGRQGWHIFKDRVDKVFWAWRGPGGTVGQCSENYFGTI